MRVRKAPSKDPNSNGTESLKKVTPTTAPAAPRHCRYNFKIAERRVGLGELTDAGEDDQDHEDIGDGMDGKGEGRKDLAQSLYVPKKTENSERSHNANEARVLVCDQQRHDAHHDHEKVDPGPGIFDQREEPVGISKDNKLNGEEYCEDKIDKI